ncbi:hypothetical protein ACOSP7_013381 [Xanthoceras sorbifolium]
MVGLGSIIRNDQGMVMAASSCKVDAGISVDNAEAMAILSGIQPFSQVSSLLVTLVSLPFWLIPILKWWWIYLMAMVALGLILARLFLESLILPVLPRLFPFLTVLVCNAAAHALARLALSLEEDFARIEEIHESLISILLADNQGAL